MPSTAHTAIGLAHFVRKNMYQAVFNKGEQRLTVSYFLHQDFSTNKKNVINIYFNILLPPLNDKIHHKIHYVFVTWVLPLTWVDFWPFNWRPRLTEKKRETKTSNESTTILMLRLVVVWVINPPLKLLGVCLDCTLCNSAFIFLAESYNTVYNPTKNTKSCILMIF